MLHSGLGSLGPTLGPDVEWSERGAEVAAEIGEPIVTVLVLLHQAGTGQVTYAVVEDAGREAFATREQRASTDRAIAKLPEDTERPPVAQKIERSHDRSAGDRAPNWLAGLRNAGSTHTNPLCFEKQNATVRSKRFGFRNIALE